MKRLFKKKLSRYGQIATVLAKYGLDEFMSGISGPGRLKFRKKKKNRKLTRYERIRMALEELGTSFVKLGQMLSARSDLLPQGLIKELEKLREHVKPFPGEDAAKIVENELGKPLDKIFEYYEKEPFASASIAQVHRAKLLTGEEVVLKVRRPGIEKQIKADIEIMKTLAKLPEKNIKRFSNLNLTGIVLEFERSINKELDFFIEAANIDRFAGHFQVDSDYYVPKVFSKFSGERVVMMEYIEGIRPSDRKAMIESGIDPDKIARTGTRFVFEQIFKAGFFHGDPHDGNIRILSDGRICFLDYGLMGTMPRSSTMQLGNLLIGFVRREPEKITETVLDITEKRHYSGRKRLEADISDLIDKYSFIPLEKLKFGTVVAELTSVMYRHEIKLPTSFYMLAKAVVTIEGVTRNLSPNFVFAEFAKPYAKEIVKQRMSFSNIARTAYESGEDLAKFLKVLPSYSKDLLEQAKDGNLKVSLDHTGLDGHTRKAERSINRLSFSMLTASLVIGSSIMTVSDIPPLWNEVSILGAGGFIISGVMAVILLFEILKHGKL